MNLAFAVFISLKNSERIHDATQDDADASHYGWLGICEKLQNFPISNNEVHASNKPLKIVGNDENVSKIFLRFRVIDSLSLIKNTYGMEIFHHGST